MLFRGWAAALRSDIARGLGDMREALASAEVACSPSDFPVYYEMFADVYERAGRFDEGLNTVNECLAHAEYAGRVYWNAELHRRRGELMCAAGADPSAVTDRFENALTDARAQMRCSSCCAPPQASRAYASTRGGSAIPVACLRAGYADLPRRPISATPAHCWQQRHRDCGYRECATTL